jgi:hypothetical protein
MRGLTQIRDGRTSYPAVRALKALAADVRSILGHSVRIGYAADWSEYFGHQPPDGSGDVLFHLDPLWADPNIDFVGIDNYMPISDWRDGGTHADAQAGSPYQLDYLAGNVVGGEGFDWYYADAEARAQQERTPISDGAHAEPWVYRYKDLRSWWNTPHHDRIGGVRSQQTTGWVPRSKPFWFTELGCPAVDKGTNQPNVFYDAKSSESFLPHYSDGSKDEYLQQRYFQSVLGYWGQTSNNPWSEAYGGRMVRLDRAFCWAWDARPWPEFPDRLETWVDGTNYAVGHWLNGRVSLPSVASVVAALASNTSARLDLDEVHGLIAGYVVAGVESGRQSLQNLQIAYDLQAVVSGDALVFRTGWHGSVLRISPDRLVREGQSPTCTKSRSADTELASRVTLTYVRSAQDYQAGVAEMVEPVQSAEAVSELSVPLVLEEVQADEIVARWLSVARSAQDTLTLAFPWSMVHLTAGDVFQLDSPEGPETLRVERVAEQQARQVAASRVSRTAKGPARPRPEAGRRWTIRQPTAAFLQFLDVPLIMGDESPHAPYAAVLARPWAEPIALYSATQDHAYELNHIFERPSRVGRLLDPLPVGYPGLWNGWSGRVELDWGALAAAGEADVLNGANLCALRPSNGEDWEVVQFAEAQLVAPAVYRIDRLLRGQLGTDAVARPLEAGADIVLLDSGVPQLEVAASARGIDRHYRFGPLSRAYSDSSFRHLRAAFRGVGLRPLSPVHIRARRLENGDVEVRWVRRTRVGGDGWMGLDVPWGEERLTFEIAVRHEGTRARTEQVSEPRFIYSRSAQTEDGVVGSTSFEVAQLSDAFGRGPARTMTLAATQMAS